MPPKNMISVTKKTHIPITEASVCCSMVAKWCCSPGWCAARVGLLSLNGDLLELVVVVGFPGDGRNLVKVRSGRWRSRHPFQASGTPWVIICNLPVAHRPQEIHHREQGADRQDRCARSGEHVEHLEFWRILPIAPWHAHVAQDELREEGEIEPDK